MQIHPKTWQKQTRGKERAFVWKTDCAAQNMSEFAVSVQHKHYHLNNSTHNAIQVHFLEKFGEKLHIICHKLFSATVRDSVRTSFYYQYWVIYQKTA